jgi:hypothetical protein
MARKGRRGHWEIGIDRIYHVSGLECHRVKHLGKQSNPVKGGLKNEVFSRKGRD